MTTLELANFSELETAMGLPEFAVLETVELPTCLQNLEVAGFGGAEVLLASSVAALPGLRSLELHRYHWEDQAPMDLTGVSNLR